MSAASVTRLELEDSRRAATAEDDSRSKNEDVFLNIAKSDFSRRQSLGRSDSRRSRFGFSTQGPRPPTAHMANEQTPSPEHSRFNTSEDDPSHLYNGTLSASHNARVNSSSASAHPLDELGHSRHLGLGSSARSSLGISHSKLRHNNHGSAPASPETEAERQSTLRDGRPYRNSTLPTIRGSSRQVSASEGGDLPRLDMDRARLDGTESTLSTAAPSTVWDELEDLKSRIKKLELTGKLPPSSHMAMSNGSSERPRTATTTVTTLSSSPKHGRKASVPALDTEATTTPSPVHRLLHSALAKAKDAVSTEVFSTLEAAVTDALTLSSLLGSNAAPSGTTSIVNGYSSSERQARRKVDSLCRSLTELCLALSEQQFNGKRSQLNRNPERDIPSINGVDHTFPSTGLSYRRSASHEPESASQVPSVNRLSNRLDARRASLASNAPNSAPRSVKDSPAAAPSSTTSTPASRLSRLSTTLRSRRLQTEDDSPSQGNFFGRSTSRAMTEVNAGAPAVRVSPRQRLSRDLTGSRSNVDAQDLSAQHTSHTPHYLQQPQAQAQAQAPQPRTPASQTNLPLRRSYIAQSSYSPLGAGVNVQPGSRRYGSSTADSLSGTGGFGSGGGVANESTTRPADPPSQTRIVAPTRTFASSYTPIQQSQQSQSQSQSRIRTNSLGTRKFGLRPPRSATTSALDGASSSMDDSID